MKEHETNYKQGLTNATALFPLPTKTQINLIMLTQKLQTTNWINATYQPKRKYLQTSITIAGQKNSFKIFRTGNTTCCHSISPKAWHFFLDFFYYTFIINCLEDSQ